MFEKTKEKMFVTTHGWDGKQYDGEGRMREVWTHKDCPGKKYVRLYERRCRLWTYHIIEDRLSKHGAHEICYVITDEY